MAEFISVDEAVAIQCCLGSVQSDLGRLEHELAVNVARIRQVCTYVELRLQILEQGVRSRFYLLVYS